MHLFIGVGLLSSCILEGQFVCLCSDFAMSCVLHIWWFISLWQTTAVFLFTSVFITVTVGYWFFLRFSINAYVITPSLPSLHWGILCDSLTIYFVPVYHSITVCLLDAPCFSPILLCGTLSALLFVFILVTIFRLWFITISVFLLLLPPGFMVTFARFSISPFVCPLILSFPLGFPLLLTAGEALTAVSLGEQFVGRNLGNNYIWLGPYPDDLQNGGQLLQVVSVTRNLMHSKENYKDEYTMIFEISKPL